jgi:hypothetical protein
MITVSCSVQCRLVPFATEFATATRAAELPGRRGTHDIAGVLCAALSAYLLSLLRDERSSLSII